MYGPFQLWDDVGAIFAAVDDADIVLRERYSRLNGSTTPLLGPFHSNAKRGVLGFSMGGQMALRFGAESATYVPPAGSSLDSLWTPNTIGVCSATGGGVPYVQESPLAPNPALADPLQTWEPSVPINLLQIHGTDDPRFAYRGGIGSENRDDTDTRMGGPGAGDGYYRYDQRPGPSAFANPNPPIGLAAIRGWVNAVTGGGVAPAYDNGLYPAQVKWTWVSGNREVTYVLVNGGGHVWYTTPTERDATCLTWEMLVTRE